MTDTIDVGLLLAEGTAQEFPAIPDARHFGA
jgi:hypothetical protein